MYVTSSVTITTIPNILTLILLISDLEVKSQRAEERKKRFDMEAAKECTFSPNTVTKILMVYRLLFGVILY